MKYPLTVLHLTDLHFAARETKGHYWNFEATELELPEHDRRGLVGSLADDLRRQKLSPDLVLITGDLLDRAHESGVSQALQFLDELSRALGISRGRLVLAPGNHDVQRVPTAADPWALWDKIWAGFYGNPDEWRGVPPHRRVARFNLISDLGVEIIAFNSCEALNTENAQEHGAIGQGQRDYARTLLSEGHHCRIAVMHHHLASPEGLVRQDYSIMQDAASVRRWLVDHGFKLAFHGHQHVDWHEVELIDDWHLAIMAGGSAGVARRGRDEWNLRLGYQVILIEAPTKGRRIRREYNEQTRRWITASGDAVRTLHFGPYRALANMEIDLSFVGDDLFRNQVARHYEQAIAAYETENYLDTLVECGAFLREVLLWPLIARLGHELQAVEKLELEVLVEEASTAGFIGEIATQLAGVVVRLSKLISPYYPRSLSARPDAFLAISALNAVIEICRSLRGRLTSKQRGSGHSATVVQMCGLAGRLRDLNFSWLETNRIARCRGPRSPDELQVLVSLGIQVLVRLAQGDEEGVTAQQVQNAGLEDFHEPLTDFAVADPQLCERVTGFMSLMRGRGKVVAVSCGEGYGRTAMMLCCYLVTQGMAVQDAIARVMAMDRVQMDHTHRTSIERFAEARQITWNS